MNKILCGDSETVLKTLPDKIIQCCVTSPPYYNIRDYKMKGQIGLEKTVEEYIQHLVSMFHEVHRVMKDDGTLWINIGDSYFGSGMSKKNVGLKNKDLIGVPWMLAFALRNDGWYLRSDIIWYKKSFLPEKCRDRCTKAHEYLFMLTKKKNYLYNYKSILEKCTYSDRKEVKNKGSKKYINSDNCYSNAPKQTINVKGCEKWHTDEDGYIMRNKRSVWTMNAGRSVEGHFAVMPEEMVRTCILAGSNASDIVLDPFSGSGTVPRVAKKLNRQYIGIDLNPEYVKISDRKVNCIQGLNLL